MRRTLLVSFGVAAVFLLVLPSMVMADASVRQDSCISYVSGGKIFARVKFSVVNFSLPVAVCDLHFIPEPQPVDPSCEMLSTFNPPGWSSFLNPFGGADWFANTPADCVAPGAVLSDFGFVLDPGYCCYIVQFTDATGTVILEQEECFCEGPLPTEDETWGAIKSLYGR
jgi:hypothetical protein